MGIKEKKQTTFFYIFTVVLMTMPAQVNMALASSAPLIVVFSSRDNTAYHQVLAAFKHNLLQKYSGAEFVFFLLEKESAISPVVLQTARQRQPKIVLALGSRSLHAAVQQFPATPKVASMVINTDAFSQADKVTGVVLQVPPEVHFSWLRRLLPNKKTVGVLYDPKQNRQWVDDAGKCADVYGLTLVAIAVQSARDIPNALKELNRNADVLLAIPDATIYSRKTAKMVLLSSFRNKIPFVGLSTSWVKAGALYALEWDYHDIGGQCASIADEILCGISPDEIPVKSLTDKVIYSVNRRTARHMQLDIDPTLLQNAAHIFE